MAMWCDINMKKATDELVIRQSQLKRLNMAGFLFFNLFFFIICNLIWDQNNSYEKRKQKQGH